MLNGAFWFDNLLPGPWSNLGTTLSFSTLGGYSHTDNQLATQEVKLTELVNIDLGILYKVVRTPQFELATGLDNYFRLTSSETDPRTSYLLAAKNYMGFGVKVLAGYQILDWLNVKLSLAPHYVIQDLSNIALPSQLPLSRWDLMIHFNVNAELFQIAGNPMTLNLGYQGLLLNSLDSDASQSQHGVLTGIGYKF